MKKKKEEEEEEKTKLNEKHIQKIKRHESLKNHIFWYL
jgi:hypothetical protein